MNCPHCGKPELKPHRVAEHPAIKFRCGYCKRCFDEQPDEGPDHGDAADSLALQNERREDRQQRINQRRIDEQLRRGKVADAKRRRGY